MNNRRHEPNCDNCRSHSGVVRAYKLNPRNWHEDYRKLCLKCRNTLGYAPVYSHRERTEAKRQYWT